MAAAMGDAVVNPTRTKSCWSLLSRGDTATLATWTYDSIEAGGGHGGHEILNWLAVAGAMHDAPCDVLVYSPTREWICGTGIAIYRPTEA